MHCSTAAQIIHGSTLKVGTPLIQSPLSGVFETVHRDRCLGICAGEQRSANRTAWASDHSQDLPQSASQLRRSSFSGSEVWEAADQLQPCFAAIDRLVAANLRKVQSALAGAKVGPHHFCGSSGYGHGDLGRAALDQTVAAILGTESAIVRHQFVSGTHAIASALFACLRPGDELLSVAGRPYDTLEEVIGIRGTPGIGNLKDWGINYREIPLDPNGCMDLSSLKRTLRAHRCKVALIQRSCGYQIRPTFTISDIAAAVDAIRDVQPDCVVAIDNCYGEFTEEWEPGEVGADLVMGSLIKNPGGTVATGGGYVAGRQDLIHAVAARLTAPGVGLEAGCVSGETLRLMFQGEVVQQELCTAGLFLAPQMVGEALKGGRLLAEVFAARGLSVHPPPSHPEQEQRPLPSFITAVRLGCRESMEAFCRAVQEMSPVGAYVRPIPGQTPGYGHEVIFADGTFINGSTAELSADGPLREPFVVYCQGGTHWTHWALCLENILPNL